VLCYLFYRIDRKRHAAITAALGERQAVMSRSGKSQSPSESAVH
jgi:Na+/melibiose symporter-like transporter